MKLNDEGVTKKHLMVGTRAIAAVREALGGNVARRIWYRHIDDSEEGGIRKNEDAPEEVTSAKNFTLEEFSKIFYNIESAKNKMLEAYPNLEMNMTICQV